MDLITTHLNADFDAMASMIAAKKLYPEASMVFPGSQERNLREFFLKSSIASFNFDRIKDVDLSTITRLILVDIKIKGRLGPFDEVAARDDVELHIYDHHPRTDQDYKGDVEIMEPVGATTTLLVELLRKRRITITPEEATIMALGIYEDTGSLTFASTTPRDLDAVSHLMKKGAHLEIIPTFITRELDSQQVQLLYDLLTSMDVLNIKGIPVAVASATTEEYVGELALLVHKMMDMENLDVLITIVRMEDRVILVARSRLPELDVSRVADEFGGGGHPTAASASIRDLTLIQVRERLIKLLEKMVGDRINAGTIMSSPVIDIPETMTLSDVTELMVRFNINSLPVVNPKSHLIGIITRGVVERGLLHGLGDSLARDFMLTEFSTVTADSSLEKVEEFIIEKRQRMLPVMEGKKVRGVITRTDLLEAMHADFRRTRSFEAVAGGVETPQGRVRNIKELMKEILDQKTLSILNVAGRVAEKSGFRAYLVGGLVRDLILRQRNLDVDLVVEGDAIEFARSLAKRLKGRVRSHKKFKTAVVILDNEFKLDVATARTEYYKSPGAHPMIERGSIKLDLYRRDFSVNSLAVRLNPDSFGQVVDFFSGLKDLKDRTIRILHNMSFIDDPTRIIRAVRFEQKFNFRIGKHTEYLLKGAINKGYLKRAQGPRLLSEILVVLRGENPIRAFERMQELGILSSLHRSLAFDGKMRQIFLQVEKIHSWFQLLFLDEEPDLGDIYFHAIMLMKNKQEREQILKLFHLDENRQNLIRERWGRLNGIMRDLARTENEPNSSIARLLGPVGIEDLLLIMSLTKREGTVKAVSLYLSRLRFIKSEISGKILRQMGYVSGPLFREIMLALQDARVDGLVNSLAEEKKWVKENFPPHESESKEEESRGKVESMKSKEELNKEKILKQKTASRKGVKTRGKADAETTKGNARANTATKIKG
jgi:tRNA nucleotidyltransferase (CCA-adding enzyme)